MDIKVCIVKLSTSSYVWNFSFGGKNPNEFSYRTSQADSKIMEN